MPNTLILAVPSRQKHIRSPASPTLHPTRPKNTLRRALHSSCVRRRRQLPPPLHRPPPDKKDNSKRRGTPPVSTGAGRCTAWSPLGSRLQGSAAPQHMGSPAAAQHSTAHESLVSGKGDRPTHKVTNCSVPAVHYLNHSAAWEGQTALAPLNDTPAVQVHVPDQAQKPNQAYRQFLSHARKPLNIQ